MKLRDEEFIEQIKGVFDSYDDGLSEQGWEKLRLKYPEKKNRKLPIWWLAGAAASLLLVLGLFFNPSDDVEKVVLKAGTKTPKNTETPQPDSNPTVLKNEPTQAITAVENNLRITAGSQPAGKLEGLPAIDKTSAPTAPVIAGTTAAVKENAAINDTKEPTSPVVEPNVIAATKTEAGNAQISTDKGIANDENTTKPKKTTEEFLTEQSKILASSNNNKDLKKNQTANTTLDVFTGTFFNYLDDNDAKLSAGVGLNANVKLTKHVVFSFGAGISQNKVSYQHQVPVEVASTMNANKNNALAAPVYGATNFSATATNDLSFNGRLLSIDLPMVVKLYPTNKQDFYISTGINSSTYLSQKYTYNYSLSNFSVQNGEAQPQQQVETSSLKGFDFANSAIIAIGINQNLGKNTLIFEPYYKPALRTMGDKNLRISSAGLNLKFNFNGNSKK